MSGSTEHQYLSKVLSSNYYTVCSQVTVKHKLIELFQLISMPPENDDKEYFAEDADANTSITCATQTLDILALHLPFEKLLIPLVCHITYLYCGSQTLNIVFLQKVNQYSDQAMVWTIPGRENKGDFLLCYHIQTSSGTHPVSYPMGTGGSFPRC
jgi:hypothetical protein